MPKLKPETIWPTEAEAAAIDAGIAADPDSREWSEADFAQAKPASEFFDQKTYAGLTALSQRGKRGPQKAPTKERITIRLSPNVVETFRATGEGWQTRIDEALQDWIKAHKVA
ncbi:BrnA antitoxin family protein [Azonexus hydrophilus]